MFCADYVAAFIFHGILTVGTVFYCGENENLNTGKTLSQSCESEDETNKGKSNFVGNNSLIQMALGGLGMHNLHSKQIVRNEISNDDDLNSVPRFTAPLFFGISSGLLASLTLYPFDFVRGGVLQPGIRRILSAGSTVPYAGTLFGLYFTCRDPASTSSQVKWGACASACAVAAEAPLDHAKRAMIGNTRIMIGAGLLYVPFATIMLVMYDKAATKFVEPYT